MTQVTAAQERKEAEDFAIRAQLMEEHGCSELSYLYQRVSMITALKAQLLSEIENKYAG
jgi:hypothetical protein